MISQRGLSSHKVEALIDEERTFEQLNKAAGTKFPFDEGFGGQSHTLSQSCSYDRQHRQAEVEAHYRSALVASEQMPQVERPVVVGIVQQDEMLHVLDTCRGS